MTPLFMTASDPLSSALNIGQFFTSQIGLGRVILTLVMGLAVGLFIFFIYKRSFGGVMYSRSLNVSFILLTMVTALMLMLINTNLTLTLGMVGALSIIRFRTAVKDPIDTMFMFWAVGEGIAIGVAFYLEAVVAAVIIGVVLIMLSLFKFRTADAYLLIIHYDESASGTIKQLMKQLPKCRIKSKSVNTNGIELTLEVRLRAKDMGFMEKLVRMEGIEDALLVTHQGDVVA